MSFKDIEGQDKALRILSGMLRRDRIPSAMMFAGDTGIGKMLTAINFAKAVNCLNPVNFDCCDACSSCRKIAASAHPDISFTVPEKDEIKIDAVRRLEEILFLKPLEAEKKIAIIDDADRMNINAANAFLKTLEEPPENSLIILVTSNPDVLPDTIRSRCIVVRFYPLSSEALRRTVTRSAGQDVDFAAGLSMGRPGLVLSRDLIKELDWFSGLLRNMLHGETNEVWADKESIRTWLDMAFIFLRDSVIYKMTGNESDLLYGKESMNFSRKTDIGKVLDTYQALRKLRGLLDFNLNKSITWNYVSALMRACGG